MARPTNLAEPWLSLAKKLGGAGKLYAALASIGVPERSAKRVCRGTGELAWGQWLAVVQLFEGNGVNFRHEP